eukprot:m.263101 g.263101  ORF g.263101 m.263101 type:complete len:489 (+) comp48606_c0_seq1:97-1563(+)
MASPHQTSTQTLISTSTSVDAIVAINELKEKISKLTAEVEVVRLTGPQKKFTSAKKAKLTGLRRTIATLNQELVVVIDSVPETLDATLGVPDDVLIRILLMLPIRQVYVCARVSKRYHRLVSSRQVACAIPDFDRRLAKYDSGHLEPWKITGPSPQACAELLVVDEPGKRVYVVYNACVQAFSTEDLSFIQMFEPAAGERDNIMSMHLSKDNASLFTTDVKGRFRVWSTVDGPTPEKKKTQKKTDVRRATLVSTVTIPDFFDHCRVCVKQDDGVIFYASTEDNNTIGCRRISDIVLVHSLVAHREVVTALALSPDETRLYSASDDMQIITWCAKSGAKLRVFLDEYVCEGSFKCLAVSPNGKRLYSSAYDWPGYEKMERYLQAWATDDGTELWRVNAGQLEMAAIVVSPDGKLVFSSGGDGLIQVWSSEDGFAVATLATGEIETHIEVGHTKCVKVRRTKARGMMSMAVDSNGTYLYSGDGKGNVQCW